MPAKNSGIAIEEERLCDLIEEILLAAVEKETCAHFLKQLKLLIAFCEFIEWDISKILEVIVVRLEATMGFRTLTENERKQGNVVQLS